MRQFRARSAAVSAAFDGLSAAQIKTGKMPALRRPHSKLTHYHRVPEFAWTRYLKM
jgi:hypothetical protein